MKDADAQKLLTGHGRVVCKICKRVLISCRCITKHEPILVVCQNCEGEENGY